MPIQFFSRPQPHAPQPKPYYMDTIEPSRSTDSTLDATARDKPLPFPIYAQQQDAYGNSSSSSRCGSPSTSSSSASSSNSLSNPFRRTSPASPEGSWRTKDVSAGSPIFREDRLMADERYESMWTLRRSDAFDYGDESDDDSEA